MSSGFVTETDAIEARKRRQEEWEKVRQPEDPLERPEEPFDGRSLFDRLKEQKMQKDLEYEEAHKLKNLIRGLDDDEVQFLELVDQNKINAEKKQMREEEQELKEFRNRVATLQEESVDKKIQSEIKPTKSKSNSAIMATARPTQKSLLGIGIKRKNGENSSNGSSSSNTNSNTNNNTNGNNNPNGQTNKAVKLSNEANTSDNIKTDKFDRGHLKCIAILPGIGPYTESSDSEISTGSDDEPDMHSKFDLVGRVRKLKKQCQEE